MKAAIVDQDRLVELIANRPDVPAGKIEDVEITHTTIKAGTPVTVVSMRNALLMGQQPTTVSFDCELTIRSLGYEGGTWMTDSPQEVWQMAGPLADAHGDVLVGGLGLGGFTHLLHHEPEVIHVTTVERDWRVAELVGRHVDGGCGVVVADLFEYLPTVDPGAFDYGFFDIWQPTGELCWQEFIVPLRRLARGKIGTLRCWNESEMWGQLRMALPRVASAADDMKFEGIMGYYETFRRACKDAGVWEPAIDKGTTDPIGDGLAAELRLRECPEYLALVDLYLDPSHEDWETTFGTHWDATVTPYLAGRKEEECRG